MSAINVFLTSAAIIALTVYFLIKRRDNKKKMGYSLLPEYNLYHNTAIKLPYYLKNQKSPSFAKDQVEQRIFYSTVFSALLSNNCLKTSLIHPNNMYFVCLTAEEAAKAIEDQQGSIREQHNFACTIVSYLAHKEAFILSHDHYCLNKITELLSNKENLISIFKYSRDYCPQDIPTKPYAQAQAQDLGNKQHDLFAIKKDEILASQSKEDIVSYNNELTKHQVTPKAEGSVAESQNQTPAQTLSYEAQEQVTNEVALDPQVYEQDDLQSSQNLQEQEDSFAYQSEEERIACAYESLESKRSDFSEVYVEALEYLEKNIKSLSRAGLSNLNENIKQPLEDFVYEGLIKLKLFETAKKVVSQDELLLQTIYAFSWAMSHINSNRHEQQVFALESMVACLYFKCFDDAYSSTDVIKSYLNTFKDSQSLNDMQNLDSKDDQDLEEAQEELNTFEDSPSDLNSNHFEDGEPESVDGLNLRDKSSIKGVFNAFKQFKAELSEYIEDINHYELLKTKAMARLRASLNSIVSFSEFMLDEEMRSELNRFIYKKLKDYDLNTEAASIYYSDSLEQKAVNSFAFAMFLENGTLSEQKIFALEALLTCFYYEGYETVGDFIKIHVSEMLDQEDDLATPAQATKKDEPSSKEQEVTTSSIPKYSTQSASQEYEQEQEHEYEHDSVHNTSKQQATAIAQSQSSPQVEPAIQVYQSSNSSQDSSSKASLDRVSVLDAEPESEYKMEHDNSDALKRGDKTALATSQAFTQLKRNHSSNKQESLSNLGLVDSHLKAGQFNTSTKQKPYKYLYQRQHDEPAKQSFDSTKSEAKARVFTSNMPSKSWYEDNGNDVRASKGYNTTTFRPKQSLNTYAPSEDELFKFSNSKPTARHMDIHNIRSLCIEENRRPSWFRDKDYAKFLEDISVALRTQHHIDLYSYPIHQQQLIVTVALGLAASMENAGGERVVQMNYIMGFFKQKLTKEQIDSFTNLQDYLDFLEAAF